MPIDCPLVSPPLKGDDHPSVLGRYRSGTAAQSLPGEVSSREGRWVSSPSWRQPGSLPTLLGYPGCDGPV